MHSKCRSRNIFLIMLAVLLMTTLACRATGRIAQRFNRNDSTSSEELDFGEDGGEGETAVSTPTQPSDTATLGNEFETLLDGLIHENDQADNLEDFPEFEN
ncbi:MAG: hypothetical protein DWQ04_20875 [Chloroflexi bacterium]|nr:MAG: hypothetical protein DWQ04_20875 [Chloroflexota bacterium]